MNNHNEHRDSVSPSIAVVGVSALFPGSTNVRGFWRDIMEGRDQIKEIPPNYWLIEDYYDPDPAAPDKTYGKRGAFLSEIPFDAMAFGVPPNVVQQTDTSQLLGLIVAQQVLEDAAGGDFQHIDKSRISVILGATGATELVVHLGSRLQRPIWLNALRENGIPEDEAQAICTRIADSYVPWTEASFPGLLGNVVAGRIANKFDLGGTNCVVDAACASSLSALSMGLSELHLHQADMVIVGGVDTLNDILMYMCFSKTPALSVTGDCRPFSDQADGTILGEGLGMVALRRLEDAERDGDRIYAVIRGIGSSSDGKGTAVYAPKASGQAEALRRAYAVAGYSPRTVELLEAHGTATKAGDVAEFTGASSVFAEADADEKQWCAIGSIKSQIGHTKGAAGAAALIKAVLALHHKALPPTIKVERPNATLAIAESPFYINTQARPWVRDATHPRRASVSSFGFGGSNFHVTLEEYTGDHTRKPEFRPSPTELFVLSGANVAQIVVAAQQLTHGFDDPDSFQFLARATQQAFRTTDRTRLALVAKDIVDLRTKLDAALVAIQDNPTGDQRSPAGWYYTDNAASSGQGKLAFLFPGQGSQYVGMGGDLALAFAKSLAVWDEAANLEFEQGGRLHDVVFPHPVFSDDDRTTQESRLRATDWAQPAIGVASLSQLALLSVLGITPDVVGGHSFGEVTALYAAGVLTHKAFLGVARKRGELMAEAAAMFPGAMTAIAHAADQVTALLASWDTGVVIANHNSPDQVVISGIETAIEAAEAKLRTAGIRFQRLPVATAFHSSVVRPASAPFRTFLEHVAVQKPTLPVYANSTAAVYSSVPEAVRETLANQIAQPVRFAEQVEAMYAAGVRTFVEVGPSTVLTNLVKSCLGDRPHNAIAMDRKGQHGLTSLWHGLAQLVVAGVPLQFAQLWEDVACGNDPRTRKTPKLAVNISGVNYAKPYPPAGGAAALAAPNPARREALPTMADKQVAKNGGMQIHAATNGMPAVSQTTTTAPPPRMEAAPTAHRTAPVPIAPAPAPVTPLAQPIPPPAPIMPIAPPIPAPAPAVAQNPAPGLASHEALAWVGAFQELQRQTVDAHMAFLQVAEQSMRSLETLLAMGSVANLPDDRKAESAVVVPSYAPPAAVPVAPRPVMAAPVDQPVVVPDVIRRPAPIQDLHAVMMDVVTEKTGYPTEMLERGMALDTDLGIDSIKRVEILAAMRERVPALPEFDTTIMAGLRTLGEIVDYMDSQLAAVPALSVVSTAATVPSTIPVASALRSPLPAQDLHAVMMDVVTEKTGYPTEMLERGMSLDTDLGIDSIKRVEILAAVRERVLALPEFDTTIMAGLRTLGEIVDYMDASSRGAVDPTATAELPMPVAPLVVVVAPDASSLRRYVLEIVPRPAPGLAPPFLVDGTTVYITDDGGGIAQALAEALRPFGAQAMVCAAVPATAQSVICLAGLRAVRDEDAALAANAEAFAVATTIAAGFEATGGLFVTVQDTGGDYGLVSNCAQRAWLGGLAGLAKTAAQEWPKAVVRALDLEQAQLPPVEVAARLARELLAGAADLEIGLPGDGRRISFVSVEAEATGGVAAVDAGSVLVVAGGGRGVTAAAVIELARAAHPRFALLGRSTLEEEPEALRAAHDDAALKKALLARAKAEGVRLTPKELGAAAERIQAGREIRATLHALQMAGSEAIYLSCDVTDAQATAAALQAVRAQWGPITGIIHGAGVLADKRLAEKSAQDFQRVFGTKIDGLRSLLAATGEDPLTVLCLFSSVAARTGNAGQADYAMANEVLNRVANAEARRRTGCVVKSIGWGPWEGGMVTPLLKAKFDELGVPLIPLGAGARSFVAELQQAAPYEVEVVIGGMPQNAPLVNPRVAQAARPAAYDVVVNAATYPYLQSHQINGVVVIPLVLAQEWFLRAANARHTPTSPQLGEAGGISSPQNWEGGGAAYRTVQKLRVLKGIPLPAFDTQPTRLRIQVEPDRKNASAMKVTLCDVDGVVRFAAQIVQSPPPLPEPPPVGAWPTVELPGTALYGTQLFHGPEFAALQAVERLGATGAQATVSGSHSLGWGDDGWWSDPALIDGGLQLARIWGYQCLHQLTLPTALEAFSLYLPGLFNPTTLPGRQVRCIVQGKPIGQSGTRSDLWFVDAQTGEVLAAARGLEMYLSSEPVLNGDTN